jgi:KDO2-lipid IV(A) lauroyltransferase
MYYLIFSVLYLLSLLPLWILHRLSDLAWFIIYYLVGYRKEVVLQNLRIAFPEKTEKERIAIAKRFYLHLTDTFMETIKMISISEKKFESMCEMDLSKVIELAHRGANIQFHAGHQFNWELANWMIGKKMPIPFIGVYKRIHNEAFDKIFFDLRSRTGTVLVGTHEFRNRMHQLMAEQYCIGLAADQNPGNPSQAYWLQFFHKPVPFVTGPDKGAIRNKTAVVFVRLISLRRGKYRFETNIITENAETLAPGELTRTYRDILEDTIRQQPSNYLWSHRRWRWEYQKEFENNWIDNKPPIQV